MTRRLFDLPQELRLSIFEHVLSGRKTVRIGRDHLETGLLFVSKQARTEFIRFMRHRLTFVIEDPRGFAILAREPITNGGRNGRERKWPNSRPYMSKIRIEMNFTIPRGDDRHPVGNSPAPFLPPEHEIAPIDARDITFFIGNNSVPWQYYIGTRFHEQYRLMANILASRANGQGIEIDSRLLFMRRNWDWIFSTWQQCGFQDVEEVHLELHNFEFWVGHPPIHDVSFQWRPIVDFFRLLMLAPPSIPILKIIGIGSQILGSIWHNLQTPVPPNWIQYGLIPEVATEMEELYRAGKLGIKHSPTSWLERLKKRNIPQFPVVEGQEN